MVSCVISLVPFKNVFSFRLIPMLIAFSWFAIINCIASLITSTAGSLANKPLTISACINCIPSIAFS